MSECYCDYDPAVIYNRHIRRARKQYRCDECGRQINPKDTYERVDGLWEGFCWSTFFTCSSCHDLRQWVQNSVPCFCWAHGNMIEDAKAAIEDARYRAPEETVGLQFGFNRRRHQALLTERQKREGR